MLFILNDPPYGSERTFNGLRLAGAVAQREDAEVKVFLMGDAVGAAGAGQKLADGYYHLDRMLASCARHGADIGCCSTCLDARGFTDSMLIEGTRRATLEELADWTLWADQVVTFWVRWILTVRRVMRTGTTAPHSLRGPTARRRPARSHRARG
jgi:uncharacterized protein involved in oxidation of intracellular sulfur